MNRELKKLLDEMRDNDDRTGRYSDHEGADGGPTLSLWTLGYAKFRAHCLRAIRDHETTIVTIRKLQKLNEARNPKRHRKSPAPQQPAQPSAEKAGSK